MDASTASTIKDLLAAPSTTFVLGIVASVIAAPLWLLLSGGLDYLKADLPHLAHKWEFKYIEPDGQGSPTASYEHLQLKQFGTHVWGTAIKPGDDRTSLTYKGRIKRRSLVMTYRLSNYSAVTVGSGALHALIADDDNSIEGWCIWHDRDTKRIESSPIEGRKVA